MLPLKPAKTPLCSCQSFILTHLNRLSKLSLYVDITVCVNNHVPFKLEVWHQYVLHLVLSLSVHSRQWNQTDSSEMLVSIFFWRFYNILSEFSVFTTLLLKYSGWLQLQYYAWLRCTAAAQHKEIWHYMSSLWNLTRKLKESIYLATSTSINKIQ